ncbi:MAG: SDR family oxidoreductase [Rhodospirillaceae bacterium]|nr:MAG: SDR family oxidoreductase [Rhodospirillaceae bacterium]
MPKTPDFFQNRTILITGGASGIGRATAAIFAREGANVIIADIDAEGAKTVARELRSLNVGAEAVAVDVTDRTAVDDMIAKGTGKFGQIDFLFNSAGSAGRRASFLDIDAELWRQTYALNVDGVFNTMQSILPHMLDNGYGVIVNIASMAHRRGGPGHSTHYASAKGAVVTLTMGVAREFVDRGIRALSISPGPIDTAFQAISSPELKQRMTDDVPMKRMGTPEEIGEMVLFMCSDGCEFMTADTVYINGGGGFR